MASSKKTINRKTADVTKPVYLTKKILVSAATKGIKAAAEETMRVMGYNVIAKDGWVVKIFPDGHTEKISEINQDMQNYDFHP